MLQTEAVHIQHAARGTRRGLLMDPKGVEDRFRARLPTPLCASPAIAGTIPLRLAKLTALMNYVSKLCAATHTFTFGSGWGRTKHVGVQ